MLVTCQICKQKINKNTAYCVPYKNGTNKYYCSKEEYDTYKNAIKQHQEYIDVIVEQFKYFLDYSGEPYGIVKSLLHDPAIKGIDISTIAAFVVEFREKIKRTINKKRDNGANFDNPWLLGKYINAILANEITIKKWKAKIEAPRIPEPIKQYIDLTFYNPDAAHTRQRISLDELEDLVDD